MTDLDIRETARRVAKAVRFRHKGHDYSANRHYKLGFEDGAQWAVERLPDREAVMRALATADGQPFDGLAPHMHEVMYGKQADVVLALIREKLT